MKKLVYVIIVIFIVFLVLGLRNEEPVEEIPISVEVSDSFEVNLDDGTLNYGSILAGMVSTRKISISNPYPDQRTVVLKVSGLEEWVSLSEGAFVLEGESEKIVSVDIEIPVDAEFGKYNSVLEIYLN
jgi:hypothetical protein